MVDTSMLNGLDPFGLLDTESERVARFFDSIDEKRWTHDTRCEGWRVRELLSHLAGVETYHLACLNDTIPALFEEGAKHGATDMNSFNDWVVRARADLAREEVLDEWRTKNAEVRNRMRKLGADGSMSSSVGPYPVGLMTFHVASEYATHGDDMDAPVSDDEREDRTAWRHRVSRFALSEAEKSVDLELRDGAVVVRSGGKETTLSDAEFVEAVTARLKTIDPELQEALRALA
jgi:uncharacterized protein (TIGR03083 family)